ncbi:MAG: hypothetical protein GXY83_27770 [Rhodopirellula sp.]|nr:hypothetical protein [Rhodopirellula sp.]
MKPQRLDLVYTIAWETRWHVGSGFDSAAADRLIRRYGSEKGSRKGPPFVPGSQLKGVLRHQCERLALALGADAVDPHATSESQQRHLVQHFRPLGESELLVDRLFGSRYQGECLFVDNALPATEGTQFTSLRTRTALDRVTGTVLERHLFTTELAEGDNVVLQGHVRARHPPGVLTVFDEGVPYEYALLIAAMLSIDSLGGDKSAGLGRCRVSILGDQVMWNGQALSVDTVLSSFEEFADEDWAAWIREVRREGGQE